MCPKIDGFLDFRASVLGEKDPIALFPSGREVCPCCGPVEFPVTGAMGAKRPPVPPENSSPLILAELEIRDAQASFFRIR